MLASAYESEAKTANSPTVDKRREARPHIQHEASSGETATQPLALGRRPVCAPARRGGATEQNWADARLWAVKSRTTTGQSQRLSECLVPARHLDPARTIARPLSSARSRALDRVLLRPELIERDYRPGFPAVPVSPPVAARRSGLSVRHLYAGALTRRLTIRC